MISIKVNDQSREFKSEITINELLQTLNTQVNGIAVAINNKVLRKEDWSSQIIKDRDIILIIKSTQGG